LRDQKHSPSFSTLKKYANACGKKLVVQIVWLTDRSLKSSRLGDSKSGSEYVGANPPKFDSNGKYL
jgi:rRNA maturation protein Nop10